MAYSKRVTIDAYRTLAFGAIGAAYAAVGAALASPARIIIMTNLTDVAIDFSVDGATDQFYIPSGGFKLLDLTANAVGDMAYFLAEGTVFYARQAAGAAASGLITIEVIRN